MTANELRIGNYLKNNGVVVKIDARSIFNIWDDKGLKKYTPIPITEEWLLSFGFDKILMPPRWVKYTIKSFALMENIVGNIIWYENIEIKYVHQLQNLYFAIKSQEL